MTKIRPLPGFVLVEPIEDDTTSAGGVYLPDSSKDKPSRGKVVACGDVDTYNGDLGMMTADPGCPVEDGQTVIYKKWTNQEVQDEGKTYLLVPFSDLLAVIE